MQQTINLSDFGRTLRAGKGGRFSVGGASGNPDASDGGRGKSATGLLPGRDSFEVTKNISELLSPACGMTEEEKAAYLAHIMAKLKSGKRLTAEELRFLQAEYPILYQQAARVQAMRDSLESRLNHCASKSEAVNVFSDAMSSVSEEDPMKEYIIAAYQDVMDEFQESDYYQNLPQDEEDRERKQGSEAE